jgi:crotonobetainyl-CoA:carnitine CoA-transferase CaiB-like acyl-CoA transferase
MDHHGANLMAFAVLAALHHRDRTGEGQWIDMATVEAGAALLGPDVLDHTVNGRPSRRADMPASNRAPHAAMVPHGIYPAEGDDQWVAIACRDDDDWRAFGTEVDEPWTRDQAWTAADGRRAAEDRIDGLVANWTRGYDKFALQARLLARGVPAAAVQTPPERIEHDRSTAAWGLWPEVEHAAIGPVRVDGLPIHLSDTDWRIDAGAPTLGQHNHRVFGDLLGLTGAEIAALEADHVI